MRFVMHVSFPPAPFNKALLDGSVGQKMNRILETVRPEAAYFCAKDGNRGGYFIVNLDKTSDMPRLAEPFFINFEATVEFLPAMTPEDLQAAGLEEIAKTWR